MTGVGVTVYHTKGFTDGLGLYCGENWQLTMKRWLVVWSQNRLIIWSSLVDFGDKLAMAWMQLGRAKLDGRMWHISMATDPVHLDEHLVIDACHPHTWTKQREELCISGGLNLTRDSRLMDDGLHCISTKLVSRLKCLLVQGIGSMACFMIGDTSK